MHSGALCLVGHSNFFFYLRYRAFIGQTLERKGWERVVEGVAEGMSDSKVIS